MARLIPGWPDFRTTLVLLLWPTKLFTDTLWQQQQKQALNQTCCRVLMAPLVLQLTKPSTLLGRMRNFLSKLA